MKWRTIVIPTLLIGLGVGGFTVSQAFAKSISQAFPYNDAKASTTSSARSTDPLGCTMEQPPFCRHEFRIAAEWRFYGIRSPFPKWFI